MTFWQIKLKGEIFTIPPFSFFRLAEALVVGFAEELAQRNT